MAKNDTILIDGIIDDLLIKGKKSLERRDEVFEIFAFKQLLKNYDLSQEEIEFGWLDGRYDGGIDGFFIFINGQLLTDSETFPWPKRNAEIAVWLITCKHHDTFQEAPLNLLLASITELMNLSIDAKSLKGAYSTELILARNLFFLAYKKLASALAKMSVHYVYASRGNTLQIGDSVIARANQIEAYTANFFSSCLVKFRFVGAAEFVDLHRQMLQTTHELPFLECISQGSSYVILTTLNEYYTFVSDEAGHLRRYFFETNIRDFLGTNRVNEDIAASLEDSSSANFWWLNNGVTILTTAARIVGKTIQLDDVQIVNGLQTTESIYRFFSGGDTDKEGREILVKVISSSDSTIRDKIIRATNNQSSVELASLHATDRIQRDIEEILLKNGWYYERRNNYYRNCGKPESRIVTPLFIAGGSISMLLKNPTQAAKLKSKFMKNEVSYSLVFSDTVPLTVWPKIADILRKTENVLDSMRSTNSAKVNKLLSSWRNLTAFLTVARIFGQFSFSASQLANLNENLISEQLISESWELIKEQRSKSQGSEAKNPSFIMQCCYAMAQKYKLENVEAVDTQMLPGLSTALQKETVTPEFVEKVNALLPAQPWKRGIHKQIAKEMDCRPTKVSAAIDHLIATKKRNHQIKGVVYDMNGTKVDVEG